MVFEGELDLQPNWLPKGFEGQVVIQDVSMPRKDMLQINVLDPSQPFSEYRFTMPAWSLEARALAAKWGKKPSDWIHKSVFVKDVAVSWKGEDKIVRRVTPV